VFVCIAQIALSADGRLSLSERSIMAGSFDYLVVGAGAVGIGFADVMVSDSQATLAIVDQRQAPGGHWNDAYPFVRLHHPSHFYGVASRPLGDLKPQSRGWNAGLLHQASAPEILDHYHQTMEQHLLASGRVKYFPMSRYADGAITSLLSGQSQPVTARKIVDATLSGTSVPSTHTRNFAVADGVACVPVNDLTRVARTPARYCVVGAGKTAVDALVWLIEQGVSADHIRWIVPRDAWWLDRAKAQFSNDFFAASVDNMASQVEALGAATSLDDLFLRLEACGGLLRLDPNIQPTMFHGATITIGERDALRAIKDVVRLGRVKEITRDQLVLDRGTVPALADTLYVDCSAAGFAHRRPEPVFQGNRIALQMLKSFAPTFSAALIGRLEATLPDDDAAKNSLAMPVPTPRFAEDWLPMMAASMTNQNRWGQTPAVLEWILKCRLDPMTALMRNVTPAETDKITLLQRSRAATKGAVATMPKLMAEYAARRAQRRA
jgi:hypothetical protein